IRLFLPGRYCCRSGCARSELGGWLQRRRPAVDSERFGRVMAGSGTAHLRNHDESLLRVDNLVVEYSRAGQKIHAVSNVSLDVRRGEALGLVGESGCGKSTAARAILLAIRPTSGQIWFNGQELTQLSPRKLRRIRSKLQMIFQDPISSLNSRRKVRDIVSEGL